jgi:hypothetical protein
MQLILAESYEGKRTVIYPGASAEATTLGPVFDYC